MNGGFFFLWTKVLISLEHKKPLFFFCCIGQTVWLFCECKTAEGLLDSMQRKEEKRTARPEWSKSCPNEKNIQRIEANWQIPKFANFLAAIFILIRNFLFLCLFFSWSFLIQSEIHFQRKQHTHTASTATAENKKSRERKKTKKKIFSKRPRSVRVHAKLCAMVDERERERAREREQRVSRRTRTDQKEVQNVQEKRNGSKEGEENKWREIGQI